MMRVPRLIIEGAGEAVCYMCRLRQVDSALFPERRPSLTWTEHQKGRTGLWYDSLGVSFT